MKKIVLIFLLISINAFGQTPTPTVSPTPTYPSRVMVPGPNNIPMPSSRLNLYDLRGTVITIGNNNENKWIDGVLNVYDSGHGGGQLYLGSSGSSGLKLYGASTWSNLYQNANPLMKFTTNKIEFLDEIQLNDYTSNGFLKTSGSNGTISVDTTLYEQALSKGDIEESTSSVLNIFGGTNAVIGSGVQIQVKQSSSGQSGFLSSTDWSTFNSKENALTKNALTASSPLSLNNSISIIGPATTLSLSQSSGSTNGWLSSTDWSTFNNKENALTKGNLTESTSSVLTIGSGTGAVIGSGTTLTVKQANSSQSGYLSSTDWSTFNNKQSALTISTGLTNSSGTITNDLSTGKSGSQIVKGGTAASEDLSFWTTTSGTKGSYFFTDLTSNGFIKTGGGTGELSVDTSSYSLSNHNHSGTYEPVLTKGNLTESTSSVLTIGSGTGAVIGSGTTLTVKQANTSQSGYLSNTDWNTFNGKQNALTISTGLTNSANTITSDLSTGKAGSQIVKGGTAAGEDLSFWTTTNGTKGSYFFTDLGLGYIKSGASGELSVVNETYSLSSHNHDLAYAPLSHNQAASTISQGTFPAGTFVFTNSPRLSDLTSNGFLKTGSSNGTLSVDTNSYSLSSHNHSGTYETPITFSTGLTDSSNTITNDLSTGKAGGGTVKGGTGSGDDLSFWSTTNATKGSYFFTDLTSNGFVKTSGSTGLLSVDTSSYSLTSHNHDGTYSASGHSHDHGTTTGLSDDDHTQYVLLAGRSGGQILYGGTGSGDDLTLKTSSNATKGTYFLSDLTSNGFLKTGSSNGTLSVDTNSYSLSSHNHSGVYEPVLTKGNLTESTSSVLTIGNGTGAVIGSGTTIQVKQSSTSVSGFLSSTDWNTFNGKAAGDHNHSGVYETPITFSTGLTDSSNTITNDLSTGKSGGGIVKGGTGSGDDLSFHTTTNATKGSYFFTDLTSNGFVKTSGSTGLLSVDTNSYSLSSHNHDGTYSASGHSHDHGTITGLSDDDHTQYVLLAGRSGGQIVYGGTGSGDDLTLKTSSNATKGTYFLSDLTSNGFLKTGSSNGTLSVDTNSYSLTSHNHSGTYEPVLTKGNLTESTSSVLTIGNGTGAVLGSGTTIQVKQSSTSVSGFLSSTDWNTFNGKAAGDHNHSGVYETPITFSTGLTDSSNTITNDLSTGKAGGGTVKGGTGSGDDLSFWSTTNATKGSYFFTDLTSNGFVKTSGSNGLLSVDTNSYSLSSHNHDGTYSASGHSHDHGTITGLGDDDHTQYVLLAGRSGGQIVYGGTGSGDDLTLKTSSNATKGTYFLSDLTSNGFLKTSGSNGTLSVDTNSYSLSGHIHSGVYEPVLTKGNLTETTSSVLTLTGNSNCVIGSGVTIQVKQASTSVSGYLSSTDWNTFNGKQNALTGTQYYLPYFSATNTLSEGSLLQSNNTNFAVGTTPNSTYKIYVLTNTSGASPNTTAYFSNTNTNASNQYSTSIYCTGSHGTGFNLAANIKANASTIQNIGAKITVDGSVGANNKTVEVINSNTASTTNDGVNIAMTGTGTSNRGIYIDSSGATSNYAIYANSGKVQVNDLFGLGAGSNTANNLGTITVTKSRHVITGSGTVSTINGGATGDIVLLTSSSATLDDGGGNIECNADITLNSLNDWVMLMYDGSKWQLISKCLDN